MTKQEKVAKVMREWKEGKLTSHGKVVKDYDQAVAIALSEAGLSKYAKGGEFKSRVDFIREVKKMHKAIDEIVLKDGTHIKGKELMRKGGEITKAEYEKALSDYDKYGEYLEDAIEDENESEIKKYKKLMEDSESVIHRYERKDEYAVGGEITQTQKDAYKFVDEIIEIHKDKKKVRQIIIDRVNSPYGRTSNQFVDAMWDRYNMKFYPNDYKHLFAEGGEIHEKTWKKIDNHIWNYGEIMVVDESKFGGDKVFSVEDNLTQEVKEFKNKKEAYKYAIEKSSMPSGTKVLYLFTLGYEKEAYEISPKHDDFNSFKKLMDKVVEGSKIFKYAEGGGISSKELKGYRVNIYSNNSAKKSSNNIANEDSYILVTDGIKGDSSVVNSDEPYLKLVKRELFGKTILHAEPVNIKADGSKMFGGKFVWSIDSRFRNDISESPIQLHDRVEKYAVGGEIGNEVTFKSYGETRKGIISDKVRNNFEVVTDSGTVLVEPSEVIEFHEAPVSKKKRFGFFADGGEIESKIESLKKNVLNSKYVSESVKEKAKYEIERLEKQLHESKESKSEEKKEGKTEEYEVYIDFLNKEKNFKKDRKYFETYIDAVNFGKREIEKFNTDMIKFNDNYDVDKAMKSKKSLKDKKNNDEITIQKLYLIEGKAEDLINYQHGGIQSQSIDKIKKYVEYINKEVSKLDVPFGSEIYDVLEDENAHSLNLTLGLLGFYKNEKDNGDWARTKTSYKDLVNAVNEVKGIETEYQVGDPIKSETKKSKGRPKKEDLVKLTLAEKKRLDYLQSKEDTDSLTKSEEKEYEALVVKYRKTKDYKGNKSVKSSKEVVDKKELVGYAIVDPISADIMAFEETIPKLIEAHKKLETKKGFEDIEPFVYEVIKKGGKKSLGNKIEDVKFKETSKKGAVDFKPKFKVGDYVSMFEDEHVLKVIKVDEHYDMPARYDLKSNDGKIDRRNISETKLTKSSKEVKGDLPKSKYEIGDKVGVSGYNEIYEIKDKSYRNNLDNELTWVYYLPEYSSVLVSEKNLKEVKTPSKPKIDRKKIVEKAKAKKKSIEDFSNKPSKGHKRNEASDKKREALPLGKRVSASGKKYYENRLNHGDFNKGEKFEKGGEIKSSGFGLDFLKW